MRRSTAVSRAQVFDALRRAAYVASVMVDGDDAMAIITERAAYYLAHPDPQHEHLVGDYYDVDAAAFLRMKKLLLRLERLVPRPCNASLWVLVRGAPDLITVAVHNGRMHRFYRFGENARPLAGPLARCIRSGRTVSVPPRRGQPWCTVLAPVRDGLDQVVGCVELTTADPDESALLPAWS